MTTLASLIDPGDPRIEITHDGEIGSGRCVMLWVSRSQRATGNPAANVAIELANTLRLPVVAVFCLTPHYPCATLRAYQFMAEGLHDLPEAFAARGIGWVCRVGEPERVIPEVAKQIGAVAVIADLGHTRHSARWRDAIGKCLKMPMAVVDADTVVPVSHFTKEEWAPRTIRPKILRVLPGLLKSPPNPKAIVASSVMDGPDPLDVVETLPLDRSVAPSPRFQGGTRQAQSLLSQFLAHKLPRYDSGRQEADRDATSTLSPYLHFGQIGVADVAAAAVAAAGSGVRQEAIDAFLNELVVQRELCINFALHNPDYDRFAGLPEWGRNTLAKHAGDPRPVLYDRSSLEQGETADRLWNAAQRQMVAEGWMPNRLRMYWGKQLLLWTATPEEAFAIAVELNDRYFVDGRNPNGYAGVAWAIGGRHDRPFPPERPVTGLVRPMTIRAMRRYFDVDAYIDQIEQRYGR